MVAFVKNPPRTCVKPSREVREAMLIFLEALDAYHVALQVLEACDRAITHAASFGKPGEVADLVKNRDLLAASEALAKERVLRLNERLNTLGSVVSWKES